MLYQFILTTAVLVLVALAEEADAEGADAEIPEDTSAETSADAEIPGCTNVPIPGHTSENSPVIIESSSSNSPMFNDATLEEVDIDLLIHGVTPPEPIKFRPLVFSVRNQLVYNLVFMLEGKVV